MISPPANIELPRGFEDLRGRVFNQRYAVSEVLSVGRHHVVFAATDRKGAGQVLLRVMRPSLRHDRATIQRFEQRVQAARRASSLRARPSIDAGAAKDGKLFLVCKRPPGRSLGQYVEEHEHGRLPWKVVEPLLQGFVEVLRAAHDRRIVHGGMMPDSFWIEEPEGAGPPMAYLVDLGANPEVRLEGEAAAEVSRTTMLAADMEFTAPETLAKAVYDERTDVYLLGLIAWFMLVGRPPFQGNNHFQVASQQVHHAVPSMRALVPEIPEVVEELIERMLAKRAEERPQTMGKVGAELMLIANGMTAPKRGAESIVVAAPPLARPMTPPEAVVSAPVAFAEVREAVFLGDAAPAGAVVLGTSVGDAPHPLEETSSVETVIYRASAFAGAISLPVLDNTEVLGVAPVSEGTEVFHAFAASGNEVLGTYPPVPSTDQIERAQLVDFAQSSQSGGTAVVSQRELGVQTFAPAEATVPVATATWPPVPTASASSMAVISSERHPGQRMPHGIGSHGPRTTPRNALVWFGVGFGVMILLGVVVGMWLAR